MCNFILINSSCHYTDTFERKAARFMERVSLHGPDTHQTDRTGKLHFRRVPKQHTRPKQLDELRNTAEAALLLTRQYNPDAFGLLWNPERHCWRFRYGTAKQLPEHTATYPEQYHPCIGCQDRDEVHTELLGSYCTAETWCSELQRHTRAHPEEVDNQANCL
jgi:hypothetical protein